MDYFIIKTVWLTKQGVILVNGNGGLPTDPWPIKLTITKLDIQSKSYHKISLKYLYLIQEIDRAENFYFIIDFSRSEFFITS